MDPHELPPDQASIVRDLQSLVPALWHQGQEHRALGCSPWQ
jgi:hypothetical protein